MAIIYSYPLNDDIKPLDELVGTTEKNINGQLKTVTRNFLLQDLAEFFIVDGGLQKAITLTTNNSTGPATLNSITGILNIPQYDIDKVTSVTATGLITSTGGLQPIISTSLSTNKLVGRYSSNTGIFEEITLGTGLSFFGNILNASSPVTPYALTRANDDNITLTLGGSPNTALLSDVSLTLGWNGTLADSRIASANIWNAKQPALLGTGFVKSTSGVITYDPNTYYLASNPNGFITLSSLSSIATGLTYNNTTGVFSLSVGYSIPTTASQTNWDNAYNYRLAGLTTTGTSGPATLVGNILNIPQYLGGGSQNLQQVTDIGATTDNTIFINTINGDNGLEINAIDGGIGLKSICDYGTAVYGQSQDTAFGGNADTGMYLIGVTQGITIISNDINVASFNQGLTAKGLIINSGASSTGNFIELNKNGIDKLIINQAGELTATKLIKEGGTSSQFLMADGSTTTGGGGVTSVTATSPITSSGGTTPVISTSMATNKLIGRSTTGTGVMEEITVGSGLILSAGTLTNTATPTPTGYYGAFQDITNQTAAVINTGYPMLLGITDLSNGVTVVSNSRITIANTGIYNIQWSAQFTNPTSTEHDVTIWLRKNGVDVPGSAGVVLVPPKHGASDGHILPSWNFLLDIVAGDYCEFVWSTVNTSVYISFSPAGNPPPSTASVVMTVTQQSGIMAGTGVTAINSLTSSTQTLATGTTGTDFVINSSGSTHTFNLPDASATARGAVTTIAQTFLGYKTFTTGLKVGVNSTFTESSGIPYLFHPTAGTTFSIGGTPGGYQNNLSVPNGTLNIGLQIASTIASFDASKNIVSLTTATYPNLTELSYVKGVTSSIQTQFTGKVSTNTAITGATNTKITYDSKGLVTAGTTLIASDIPNIAQSQVTSLTTDLGLKQDKSLSAYSIVANNTASTTNATNFTFRKWDLATYSGTLAWVGTSAPTTITAQSYSGQQVGNIVSINLSVVYTNAGVANTQVTLSLPSDFPTPVSPTGFTGALDVIAYGTGQIMANTAQTVATGARGCFLRRNAANNGYEFFINVSVATAARVAMLNLTYQTS